MTPDTSPQPVTPWATHQPLLVACAMRATNGIVECGGGYFSTPVLKPIADARGVPFVTIEENEHWAQRLRYACSGWHDDVVTATRKRSGKDWIDITQDLDALSFLPDVLFVDCGSFGVAPAYSRQWCLDWAANAGVRLVVAHDTEPAHRDVYHYSDAFKRWRFRFDYPARAYRFPGVPGDAPLPHTSALSNTDRLEWLAEQFGGHVEWTP